MSNQKHNKLFDETEEVIQMLQKILWELNGATLLQLCF